MKKCGFTILEILVVLAVLAILIGIAVPRIKGMQEQTNITKVKAELKTIQAALESYYMNHGSYPAAIDENFFFHLTKNLILESPQIVPNIMYDPFGLTSTSEYLYRNFGNYYIVVSIGMNNKIEDYDTFKDAFKMSDGGCLQQTALDAIAEGSIYITNGSGELCS